MEKMIREILLDPRITELVGLDSDNNPKIYLLHAPDNTLAPYIEYEFLDEDGSFYAENKEISTTYRLQIDIYTKGSYTKIKDTIKEVLSEYEDISKEFGGSNFEESTKLFHYILRYNYECESEE
ncbi:hypothetical protein [Clostridium sp. YIM B02551]|uniref:hypothetical protein n=1 Tax=Clostridium sp. YIM B02551 TaxID=2910679 RepID=UPI001EECBC96|nr:hypothetical protein [Clostridium sp. YIM B02551]